jgi:DNA-binding response OmpR family regulator
MRILIIEDDQDMAGVIQKAMRADRHAADAVYDGRAGEALALSDVYDLIILDIMLPYRDGFDVVRTLRQEGVVTPVLMLTARDAVDDRVAGLDSGADDYLIKPFAVTELRARVRSLLRRQRAEPSPLLSADGVTLNPSTHEVRLDGALIELTSKEYAILEYLLRNKNRLLSKGMIAEHVWDFQFDSDYNLIEVYIRRLRKKLEHRHRPCVIRTVRNGGYMIRDTGL